MITGQDSGFIQPGTPSDGTITFENIQNLVGSSTADNNFRYLPGGSITGSVDGNGSLSRLVLDASFDNVPENVVIDNTSVSGLFASTFIFPGNLKNIQYRTIKGGSGGNHIFVKGTAADLVTEIDAGTGNDTLNVQATSGQLIIQGVAGQDTVRIGDSPTDANGVLRNINAEISVKNTSGHTDLILDDSLDDQARTVIFVPRLLSALQGLQDTRRLAANQQIYLL